MKPVFGCLLLWWLLYFIYKQKKHRDDGKVIIREGSLSSYLDVGAVQMYMCYCLAAVMFQRVLCKRDSSLRHSVEGVDRKDSYFKDLFLSWTRTDTAQCDVMWTYDTVLHSSHIIGLSFQ